MTRDTKETANVQVKEEHPEQDGDTETSTEEKPTPLSPAVVKEEKPADLNNDPSVALSAMSNLASGGTVQNLDHIQPLPSNVIRNSGSATGTSNSGSGGPDAQYMQTQSQIFVFETTLANKAAEAVMQSLYPSIIAFHCAQAATKKFLENHPLKMNQFIRPNPAQWITNLAQMKNSKLQGVGPNGLKGRGPSLAPEYMGMRPNQWQGGGPGGCDPIGAMNMMMSGPGMMGNAPRGMMRPTNPRMPGNHPSGPGAPMMMQGPPTSNNGPGAPQPSLQGVKVPDENLTPQQRAHREEQFAKLRRMEQMLFPEQHNPDQMNMMMMMPRMQGPGGMVMMGPGQPNTPSSVHAQIEWQKLRQEFFEERQRKVPGMVNQQTPSPMPPSPMQQTPSPMQQNQSPQQQQTPQTSPRIQGPPPPYMSPAMQSPGGGPSPVPSPRSSHTHPMSPASNPGTPQTDFNARPPSTNNSADGMFGGNLQQFPQQKPVVCPPKEPNLMPVPSPQQIQYLNTFEAQELTIQKQPNTSLRDTDIMSPSLPPTSLESSVATNDCSSQQAVTCRMASPDAVRPSHQPRTPNMEAPRFPVHSPKPSVSVTSPGFQPSTPTQPPVKPGKMSSSPFHEISPTKLDSSVPLNPNMDSAGMKTSCSKLFDPISSMADMTQQLTNMAGNAPVSTSCVAPPVTNTAVMSGSTNTSPSVVSFHTNMQNMQGMQQQGGMGGAMMGNIGPQTVNNTYVNATMTIQQMNVTPMMGLPVTSGGNVVQPVPSPKSAMMMGMRNPRMRYSGTNVQVKPSAPNTIQYLPARPQSPGQRPPLSIDFLQRFTAAGPSQYSNNMGGPGPMPMNGPMMGPNVPIGMAPGGPSMNMTMNMGGGGMPTNPMGPRGNPGPMMRGPGLPQMGNPMFPGQQLGEPMFNPGGNPSGQMFMPGSKGSPMPMGPGGAPDPSQPLPPSMGQANNFKGFMTTTDPNYAQQFHNFQQQLYATNTRTNQPMATGQSYFAPGPK